MNDQPNSETTNENPTDPESWAELGCVEADEPPLLGYLQLCADRRFHKCIQDRFQFEAALSSRESYWIHADAGGTPKMENQRIAPDYCYHQKGVRSMGWAAHGNGCGGFPPGTPDPTIRQQLTEVAQRKAAEYPEANHYVYFATLLSKGDKEEAVVYCMKYEKGTD